MRALLGLFYGDEYYGLPVQSACDNDSDTSSSHDDVVDSMPAIQK